MADNKNKTFCSAAFNHVCVMNDGSFSLCCDAYTDTQLEKTIQNINQTNSIDSYFNSNYMQQVRQHMLDGEKLNECRFCYNDEEVGKRSLRQYYNLKYPADVHNPKLKWVDLKLGNKCNLQCKMCWPLASSELMKEWNDIGWNWRKESDPLLNSRYQKGVIDQQDFNWHKKKENKKKLEEILHYIEQIKITGGEPMIQPEFWQLLETAVENKRSQYIELYIVTNATMIHPKFFRLCDQFKKVSLKVSIDGTGKVYEYIRFPGNYEKVHTNWKKLLNWHKSHPGEFWTANCIQVYNWLDLSKWLESYALESEIYLNDIDTPKFLHYSQLDEVRQNQGWEQIDKLNNKFSAVKKYVYDRISEHSRKPSTQVKQLVNFTKTQDQHRKIHIKNYIPQLGDLYDMEH